MLLHRLATAALRRGELSLVRDLAEESLAGHRRSGSPRGEAQALTSLADVAAAEGDIEAALEFLDESRRISDEVGFYWWLSGVVARIAVLSLGLGKLEDARSNAQAALSVSQAIGDRRGVVYELRLLADMGVRSRDERRAGTLWGAAEAENERAPVGRWFHATADTERQPEHTDAEFELGREAGLELSLEEAVMFALERPAAT